MFCPSCFEDDFLRDFVARKGAMSGICPSCGGTGPQVTAAQLAPYIEQLADAYVFRAQDGRPLADLWLEDWRLFSPQLKSPGALISEVLRLGAGALFVPREAEGGIPLAHWEELRREIKSVNRFFPEYSISGDAVGRVFEQLSMEIDRTPLYRARVIERGGRFTLSELGAPHASIASAGRANPVGIPYLYLANDVETALAEIKPQKGAEAIVATFIQAAERMLRVVDLVDPRASISPFKWGAGIADLRSTIPFIEALGAELSVPVQSSSAAVDYLASQYVCELIKKKGFDGVRYGSSLGGGINFAFFDPDLFRPIEPMRRFLISSVVVGSDEINY